MFVSLREWDDSLLRVMRVRLWSNISYFLLFSFFSLLGYSGGEGFVMDVEAVTAAVFRSEQSFLPVRLFWLKLFIMLLSSSIGENCLFFVFGTF